MASFISKLENLIFKKLAVSFASFKLSFPVKGLGSMIACTFSGPKASVAIAATRAESIPPDKPKTTPENLLLLT